MKNLMLLIAAFVVLSFTTVSAQEKVNENNKQVEAVKIDAEVKPAKANVQPDVKKAEKAEAKTEAHAGCGPDCKKPCCAKDKKECKKSKKECSKSKASAKKECSKKEGKKCGDECKKECCAKASTE